MKGGHAWALRLLLAAAVLAVEASFIDEAAAAEAASGGDSLRSALEAVNRRQRDLTLGSGVARSLTDYRLRPDAVGAPDLAFLAPPRDFAGDGQPENIGYGYQKSSAAGSGGDGGAGSRAAERQLLEYLSGYLEANGAGDKRSAFRERSGLRPPMTLRKRKPLPLPRSSAFRERTRGDLQALSALQARKREHGGGDADEMLREAEAEAEQEEERQREEEEEEAAAEEEAEEMEEERRRRQEQQDEEEREAEYLQLLQALWRKYQAGGPDGRREDEFTPEDLQELLASAGDTGDIDKRQYGGFDYFNNAGAMGGWQAGGMYRKRGGRQRLEGGSPSGAGFLYALKFASPAAQREALEALAEEDAAEMGDERDEDAVRAATAAAAAVANAAGAGARRMTPIEWERAAEAEAAAEAAAEDAFGPAIPGGPDDYQRLFAEGPSARKRFAYDGALLAAQRKRYPVTKRSSDFYASPPLMHRRSSAPAQPSAFAQHDELRRKKDASNGATDPKVASELNQIFGGDGSGDGSGGGSSTISEHHAHSTTTPESSSASAGGAPPGAAPPTSPPAGNGSRELTPEEQRARNHHHGEEEEEGSEGADEEQEAPLALSRVQGPPGGRLQVKKKSVDWSQYFGLDRRRKKAESDDRDARWLMDRYRTLALAAGTVKRPDPPALDMRRFDAGGDIFARNSRQHSGGESPSGRLDGVDTKLLGMEDLIVNEAVKLTGSHQGATDPTEVQEVKDRILARLAAAYSLEKMRLALREFKSSLQAQKMSRYNPENKQTEEDKKKRVAVKKEKAEEKEVDAQDETENSNEDKDEDEEKKKRLAVKKAAEEAEEVTEFLGAPRGIEPMSEGYMGHSQSNDVGGECGALESLQRECRAVGVAAGDHISAFLPLCTLHQICHICGPTVGAPSPGACDALFAREAALGCGDDPGCALAARRTAALLPRRPPAPAAGAAPEHCWPGSCLVQRFLTATLGARLR